MACTYGPNLEVAGQIAFTLQSLHACCAAGKNVVVDVYIGQRSSEFGAAHVQVSPIGDEPFAENIVEAVTVGPSNSQLRKRKVFEVCRPCWLFLRNRFARRPCLVRQDNEFTAFDNLLSRLDGL